MRLGVNIDHIASIREIRQGREPDLLCAVSLAENAGADAIVVHLREDRRHIKDRDVYLLRKAVGTRLNLEMSVARQIVEIACDVKPDRATLVPEKRREVTTEGGLDVAGRLPKIRSTAAKLAGNNIEVSLFIDPDKKQIEAAHRCGVGMVELHTGRYANARNARERRRRLEEIKSACAYARGRGLKVFAGHGLDYRNAGSVAAVKVIEELNIGYSIVCRAALVGLEEAVRQMKLLIA